MFDDGSFERLLKWILGPLVALAAAKMFWHWLTHDVRGWLIIDPQRWATAHPWWSASIALSGVLLMTLICRRPRGHIIVDDTGQAEDDEPAVVIFTLGELQNMTPTGFEQACAELLIRDGFHPVQRIGGAGDLGADVIAWDHLDRKIVVQCKQYGRPVGSREIQTFNGTARPEHEAEVALLIGLNGFTAPAAAFASRHGITLIGREDLQSWALGEHLYSVIKESSPA